MAKEYYYAGTGAGIPGLPRVVTKELADRLGSAEILKAAIANGNYKEVKTKATKAKRQTDSNVTVGPALEDKEK